MVRNGPFWTLRFSGAYVIFAMGGNIFYAEPKKIIGDFENFQGVVIAIFAMGEMGCEGSMLGIMAIFAAGKSCKTYAFWGCFAVREKFQISHFGPKWAFAIVRCLCNFRIFFTVLIFAAARGVKHRRFRGFSRARSWNSSFRSEMGHFGLCDFQVRM